MKDRDHDRPSKMGGHKPASFSYEVGPDGRLTSIKEEKPVVQKAAEILIIIIIVGIVATVAFGFNIAEWLAGAVL